MKHLSLQTTADDHGLYKIQDDSGIVGLASVQTTQEIVAQWPGRENFPSIDYDPTSRATVLVSTATNLSATFAIQNSTQDSVALSHDTATNWSLGNVTINGHHVIVDRDIIKVTLDPTGNAAIDAGYRTFFTEHMTFAEDGGATDTIDGTETINFAPNILYAIGGNGADTNDHPNYLNMPNTSGGIDYGFTSVASGFSASVSWNPNSGALYVDLIRPGHRVVPNSLGDFDPHDSVNVTSSLVTLLDGSGHNLSSVGINHDGSTFTSQYNTNNVSVSYFDPDGSYVALGQNNADGTGFFLGNRSGITVHYIAGQQLAAPTFNADGSVSESIVLANGAVDSFRLPGTDHNLSYSLGSYDSGYSAQIGGAGTGQAIQDIYPNADGSEKVSGLQPGFANWTFTQDYTGAAVYKLGAVEIDFDQNIVRGLNTVGAPGADNLVRFDLNPILGYSSVVLVLDPANGHTEVDLTMTDGPSSVDNFEQLNGTLSVTKGGTMYNFLGTGDAYAIPMIVHSAPVAPTKAAPAADPAVVPVLDDSFNYNASQVTTHDGFNTITALPLAVVSVNDFTTVADDTLAHLHNDMAIMPIDVSDALMVHVMQSHAAHDFAL